MRALVGRIPRAYRNHKSPQGRVYKDYCLAKIHRHPHPLPKDALLILREAGRTAVHLHCWIAPEIEKATERRALKILRRLQREQRVARGQLIALERQFERLAGSPIEPADPMDAFFASEEAEQ